MSLLRTLLAAGLVSAGLAAHAVPPAPLHLEVYNPGAKGIFPVSSEIISGAHEAILIDAQFQRIDAEALVQKLKASGKTLTTVYISQSDPDYYFGLDVIRAAFPNAKIVATPQTVAAIKASMNGKLAYWGPILKDNAPKTLVLPDVLNADHLTLEGRTIEIKGLNGPDAARTYLWIPSIKTVAAGPGHRSTTWPRTTVSRCTISSVTPTSTTMPTAKTTATATTTTAAPTGAPKARPMTSPSKPCANA